MPVKRDPIRLDTHARIVVDGEVAERMRTRRRGLAGRAPRPGPRLLQPAANRARAWPRCALGRSQAGVSIGSDASGYVHCPKLRSCSSAPRCAASDLMFAILASPDHCLSEPALVRYTPAVEGPGASVRHGWFVTVEGPDGAGKTTQAEALARSICATAASTSATRAPGARGWANGSTSSLLARTAPTG